MNARLAPNPETEPDDECATVRRFDALSWRIQAMLALTFIENDPRRCAEFYEWVADRREMAHDWRE